MAPASFLFGVTLSTSLANLIGQQAPPQNRQTPATRSNPEHEWYVALQSVRRTTEDAEEKAQERGEETLALLGAIRVACSRLLAGVEPKAVCAAMAADASKTIAPTIAAQLEQLAANMSAPPIAPGGGGAPVSPTGASPFGAPAMQMPAMPTGGATAGAPATASAPVSPGVVPG